MILWRFWLYSFLGYLLEKAFAAATASPHQTRKCFLLLPLCPVYGLAVLAVLALPPQAAISEKASIKTSVRLSNLTSFFICFISFSFLTFCINYYL